MHLEPAYVPLWLAVVVAIPQVLAIVANFILSWKMGQVHSEVKAARLEMNGKAAELIKVTGEAKYAEGVKDEKERLT